MRGRRSLQSYMYPCHHKVTLILPFHFSLYPGFDTVFIVGTTSAPSNPAETLRQLTNTMSVTRSPGNIGCRLILSFPWEQEGNRTLAI